MVLPLTFAAALLPCHQTSSPLEALAANLRKKRERREKENKERLDACKNEVNNLRKTKRKKVCVVRASDLPPIPKRFKKYQLSEDMYVTSSDERSTPLWSMSLNFCVRGKGTLATTNPLKKKFTQAPVTIFRVGGKRERRRRTKC